MAVVNITQRLVERRLADAIAADEAGDVASALAITLHVLRIAPEEARAHALTAVYYALLDEYREAMVHASMAVGSPHVTGEVAYWAAVARHIVGAQQLALDALDVALAHDPDDYQARKLAERCRAGLA